MELTEKTNDKTLKPKQTCSGFDIDKIDINF